ncbi:polysaccharide biosynthesis C-terminal domain-containing protein [Proteus terrae]|uniref:oligosaccharide flippase family protein n=1 Tax=Proteus terrae TaxID=1574161 RepID=UPI00301BF82E
MNRLKNIFFYSGEKYLIVLVSFITTIILSRKIEPELFGSIILIQSIVIIFSIVTLLSMDSIFIKELTVNKTESTSKSIFFIKFSFSLTAFLLYLLFSYFFSSNLNYISIIILGLPILFTASTYVDILLMAEKKIYRLSSINIILLSFNGIIKCLILQFFDLSSPQICFLLVFDQIFSRAFVIFFGIYIEKLLYLELLKITKYTIYKGIFFLKKGLPLIISSIFLIGYVRSNQFIINYFLGPTELTYFSLPIKIIDGVSIIITTYVAAVFPYLVSNIKSKPINYAALQYFNNITKIGLLLSIIFYFFSEEIIFLLFGEQYYLSVTVMKIYSIAIFFNFIFISSGKWLIATDKIKLTARRNILAFFINIVLSLVLVPLIGINGAAIASLIAWAIAGFFIFLMSDRWLFHKIVTSLICFRVKND